MAREVSLPPLFAPRAAPSGETPADAAVAAARQGCDAGLVVHDIRADSLRAAIVYAPEVALAQAAAILPLSGIAFQTALGVLAPPEVAVHLEWGGAIRLNGARAGALRLLSPPCAADAVPGWLVVELELRLLPETEDFGETPDETALFAEGCGEVDPVTLLEAWVRHGLVLLNRWSEEGNAALLRDWDGLAHGKGEAIEAGGARGTFLGVDEDFSLLLGGGAAPKLVPLTELIETKE